MADDIRLSIIDDSNRADHARLSPSDVCYYLFEYTSHRDYSFSGTNQLIKNLKKKPTSAGSSGYKYKGTAIRQCSAVLQKVLNPKWLTTGTMVPIPCSKVEGDPDYDTRIEQICRGVGPNVDVRRLVYQTASTTASHEAGDGARLTVQDLLNVYQIDEALANPTPTSIGIVDDVLTAGTHFKAMKTVLSARFPDTVIFGISIARRVFPEDDVDLIFDEG